jgi:hypothetical protein
LYRERPRGRQTQGELRGRLTVRYMIEEGTRRLYSALLCSTLLYSAVLYPDLGIQNS